MREWLMVIAALVVVTRSASAFDVASCGTTVPAGTVGTLQVDLVCSMSASAGAAVVLASGATLMMNGHTISQPEGDSGYGIGISCLGKCTVTGPGEIFGDLIGLLGRNVVVSDLSIHDVEVGLLVTRAFNDLTHRGNVVATNVTILRAELDGIFARKARLNTVTSSENAFYGINAVRLYGTNLTTNDNVTGGILASRAIVDGLIANDNAVAHGDGGFRVTRSGSLQNATLSGNGFDNQVGAARVDADVVTYRKLLVQNVTCAHSLRVSDHGENLGPIGICSND